MLNFVKPDFVGWKWRGTSIVKVYRHTVYCQVTVLFIVNDVIHTGYPRNERSGFSLIIFFKRKYQVFQKKYISDFNAEKKGIICYPMLGDSGILSYQIANSVKNFFFKRWCRKIGKIKTGMEAFQIIKKWDFQYYILQQERGLIFQTSIKTCQLESSYMNAKSP